MRRTTATLLLLLVLEPAFAGERGPVCREESVVDEITREVRASNYSPTLGEPEKAPCVSSAAILVLA